MRHKVQRRPFARPEKPTHAPRKVSISPGLLYGGFALLLLSNAVTAVGLLMAPDIARLFGTQDATVLSAYEDRISQLRLEVDRLQSRHYAQAGDINLQLQELAQQQEVLVEQHQYVRQLAEKAAELGIESNATASASTARSDTGTDPVLTGSIGAPSNPADAVAAAVANVNQMMQDSRVALSALSDEATSKTDEIVGTLATIGIKPKLPVDSGSAEGGPLLPPVDTADSPSLIDDANAVATALERFAAAKGAAMLAPVHRPIGGVQRISSTFGNRKDPFTGRLAFHSGIDFAAPQGSTVLAAGAGIVSFVGQMSGYGNVVEITHGNGLVTRYGHLSAFLVTEGQKVDTGDAIARVGSTGRSTGPHLHFEVRRTDNAVDPSRYLSVGKVLQKILAS